MICSLVVYSQPSVLVKLRKLPEISVTVTKRPEEMPENSILREKSTQKAASDATSKFLRSMLWMHHAV